MEVEDDVVGQEHVLEDREQVIALIIFFWLKVEHVNPVENNEQVDHHVDDRHSHREVSDDSHLVQVEWNLEKEWPWKNSLHEKIHGVEDEECVCFSPPLVEENVEDNVHEAKHNWEEEPWHSNEQEVDEPPEVANNFEEIIVLLEPVICFWVNVRGKGVYSAFDSFLNSFEWLVDWL